MTMLAIAVSDVRWRSVSNCEHSGWIQCLRTTGQYNHWHFMYDRPYSTDILGEWRYDHGAAIERPLWMR